METLIVIVSFAVVTSLRFTRERSTPEFATQVAPMKTQASSIVLFPTSADPKNLSRYAMLSVLVT